VGKEERMYEKIKNLCEKKGITIYKMCNELGISPSSISNLKTRENQKGLSAESTAKIADYFGIAALELTTAGGKE
jgi:transcriptional regulator with XRE-family HTH domain